MGKTKRKKKPQSRKRGTAVAEKKPRDFKGWKVCENLLHQSMEEIRKGPFQLIHVLACSELLHGVEAEVNWYIGGNSYVTLPPAVAEVVPGVYLAKVYLGLFGQGFTAASITRLRWLGARKEFMKMAKLPNSIIGKDKHGRLMEMPTFNCDSSEVEEVE